MKGQLGDRLPAAVAIAAKAMKMTPAELMKAMEGGKLATDKFMGPFLQALEDLGAPGLSAGLNTTGRAYLRFKNSIEGTQDTIMQSGLGDTLKGSMDALSQMVTNAAPMIAFVVGAITSFVNAITFLFRIAAAGLTDLTNGIRDMFGLEALSVTEFAAGLGSIVGSLMTLGVGRLSGAVKFLDKIKGHTNAAANAIKGLLLQIEKLLNKLPFFSKKPVDLVGGARTARDTYLNMQRMSTTGAVGLDLAGQAMSAANGTGAVNVNVEIKADSSKLWRVVGQQVSPDNSVRQ